jgi:hypothetical protein
MSIFKILLIELVAVLLLLTGLFWRRVISIRRERYERELLQRRREMRESQLFLRQKSRAVSAPADIRIP